MSSRFSRRMWNTVGFRLTFWYLVIFILSCSVILVFQYFFLSSSFEAYEKEEVESELSECAAQFEKTGIRGLKAQIDLERGEGEIFVLRLADSENDTLFLDVPDQWADVDLGALESIDRTLDEQWMVIQAADDGHELEIISRRLADGNILQLGMSTAFRDELMERFYRISIITIIPMVFLGFGGGLFLMSNTLRPIRSMVETLQSIIRTGKFDARIQSRQTDDELGQLISAFNIMLEKTETLINGMQDSLDSVAHDLRTPLTRLRGAAEVALQSTQEEKLRDGLHRAIEESERILTMLNTLMDISEAETGAMKLDLKDISISEVLDEVVELYSHVAEQKDVSIGVTCPKDLRMTADRNRIQQVLANVLDNAVKYTPIGGKIEVDAGKEGQQIAILVRDTGIGIPPDELPRIWDRLYRCDKSRSQQGLGLGLSFVKAIAEAHGGSVKASSEVGNGSLFSIHFLDPV